MITLSRAALLIGLTTCTTIAPQAREAGIFRTCSFTAFVTESDPRGLNVRAGPSTAHAVIGKIPPVHFSPDEPPVLGMVEVQVDASQNGWFRIRNARDNPALVDAPRAMHSGSGWVSGHLLTVKSQARTARDVADHRGNPVKIAGLAFDSDDFVRTSKVVDCVGKWVFAVNEKYKFRGWLDRLCGIQETSCDNG